MLLACFSQHRLEAEGCEQVSTESGISQSLYASHGDTDIDIRDHEGDISQGVVNKVC